MRLDSLRGITVTQPMTVASADCSLAAIRARGEIDLAVEIASGRTRRQRVLESGSLRVRFPRSPSAELEAAIINTGGGMTGGDVFVIDVAVGGNAQLLLTSTAAEKIYRSLGPPVSINIKINVDSGGMLTWLPQETILFDGAKLQRRIEVGLADDARLILIEPLVFGRTGMGEIVSNGGLHDHWRVRRNGKLIYAENTRLGGPISRTLGETAIANGGVAVASALVVPGDEALTDAIHEMNGEFHGEVGASAWDDRAVLRFCARDGAALRHDVTLALNVLRTAPLPRLWIN